MGNFLTPPPPWNPESGKKKERNKIKKSRLFLDTMIANPVIITAAVFLISMAFVVGLTLYFNYYSDEFRESLLVEAHGILLDILILGVVIFWIQQKGENMVEKRHYKDEIDDFRGWDSEEAARRIRGNIRRLNKYNVTGIDLSNCYLHSMDLNKADLSESYLWGADLSWTDLRESIFEDANLENVNLEAANLTDANLRRAYLWKSNLESVDLKNAILESAVLRESRLAGADLSGAKLMHADLSGAILDQANLIGADLSYANLEHARLDGADLRSANLKNATGLSADIFIRIRTLEGAILDSELEAELRKRLPDVFLPPYAHSKSW